MQNTHTYPLGGRIDLAAAPANGPRGPYEITALLPEAPDGEPQYAIRSEAGVERVVTEAEILTLRSDPVPEPAETAEEPVSKAKTPAQAEREAEARSAWKDYLDERDAIIRRTAELRALRLKAEAEAAEKIMRLAKSVAARAGKPAAKSPARKAQASAPATPPAARPPAKGKVARPVAVKPAESAAAQPAKAKAAPKPAVKAAAKGPAAKARPAAPAKPADKAPAKAKAPAKSKAAAKSKAPVKAAAKAVKKAPVKAQAKPKPKTAQAKPKAKTR